MAVIIYHNPRCTKSRLTVDLLKEEGVDATVVEYLKTPPSAETIDSILNLLGMQPRDLMRKKEVVYKENDLDDSSLSREQLINAMVENPILIERPIVVANGKAAIGRPPENVLSILG